MKIGILALQGAFIEHTSVMQYLLGYDMNTTIIIGNSSTFTFDRWMVTPRGYLEKYDLSIEAPE
jgi:precorrin-3B methylase